MITTNVWNVNTVLRIRFMITSYNVQPRGHVRDSVVTQSTVIKLYWNIVSIGKLNVILCSVNLKCSLIMAMLQTKTILYIIMC